MPEKLPYAWTEQEAEIVKESFRESRPAAPRRLVMSLWRYWTQRCPDRMLFADEEDNVALVLHARAYGLQTPTDNPGQAPAQIVARLERDMGTPLVPEQPTWGPRAALATQIRGALASLLVRVWVTIDDNGPVDVLVVGEGLPEIRQQIVQAALTTSLRINGMLDTATSDPVADILGMGLVRITSDGLGADSVIDIPSVHGSRHTSTPDRSVSTARGVLRDFVALLRSLERETDLVTITEIPHPDVIAFNQSIRGLADRASDEPNKAFLRPPSVGGPAVVSLLPNLPTVDDRDVDGEYGVGLELSPDLLATETYRALEQAHNRVLADRLAMDAKLRRDHLRDEIAWMTREKEAYDAATPAERRAMWDQTVLLTERFDERIGVSIRLAQPEERPTDVYYQTNVPQLIRLREEWAQRMGELADNLEKAVSSPRAPARQLAAGRFFDAVLRDVTPDESPATELAFTRWRSEVQQMMWFEWRCALNRRQIDPADLFTRHTVLVTRYLPAIGDDEAQLNVQPYTIIDQTHSAVLADAERRVLVVRDATDLAQRETATETDSVKAETEARTAWDELVRTAERTSTTDNEFTPAFLAALRAHPRHIVRWLIDELRPEQADAAEAATLDKELASAQRAAALSDGMERALMAMRTGAYRTARQCLNDLPEGKWEARAWLLRAIVECVAADIYYADIPSILGNRMPGLPSHADLAVEQATNLDAEYTEQWLRALPETDLDKGIRRLFHGVPKARANCTERQHAVLLFRRAVESVRLARSLEEASDQLSEESESIDSTLVKLGQVLEDILIGPFVSGARGDAQDLFAVLTGQEPPTYGRVAVR